ncbi:hypothetical protein CDAR_368771 [Caerostris darwini]|uniref:Uncharacterized protein n=1 Tax=Caerostris darwini TaxID=1538125 RepID=A0AAV4X0E9_9ARAC|nr:hypothetical protein CDAR_368771 [Caerostris darwini]
MDCSYPFTCNVSSCILLSNNKPKILIFNGAPPTPSNSETGGHIEKRLQNEAEGEANCRGEFTGSREGEQDAERAFRAHHESIQANGSMTGLICSARDRRKLLFNR